MMIEQKRWTEKLCNVGLFTATGFDVQDESTFTFYDANFLLPELKKYDGYDIFVNRNGDFEIFSQKTNRNGMYDTLEKGNFGQFISFRKKLNGQNGQQDD